VPGLKPARGKKREPGKGSLLSNVNERKNSSVFILSGLYYINNNDYRPIAKDLTALAVLNF